MEFIANYDVKNVFGCFENVEHHALAYSEETAAQLYDAGMKIFRLFSRNLRNSARTAPTTFSFSG